MVELAPYLRAAKLGGMSDEEMLDLVVLVATDPKAGELMPGCGGARKLRFARRGTGKSSGYRVITYFGGDDRPVFLLTVFPKGVKASLSKSERNAIAAMIKTL